MLVALRRFRTIRATAIPRTARRRGPLPGIGPTLAGVVLACRLVGAAPAETAAGRMLAAGEAAAERGWFAAARDHWHDAATIGDAAVGQRVAALLARLDAAALDADRVAEERRRHAATKWSRADWTVAWRTPAVSAACGGHAAIAPVSLAGGLVMCNTGRDVHAVALSDGRPPWRTGDDRDTCVFPRGTGGRFTAAMRACAPVPEIVAGVGKRAYAVIDQGRDGHLLACLDMSDGAEGRLAWSVCADDVRRGLPVGTATFDGAPAVDDELCVLVIRADDTRGSLAIAAFDARDGALRWVRSLGSAVGGGSDAARGRRRPCLIEDRIVVATHAGTVHAFDRSGASAWIAPMPAAAGTSAGDACVSPAVVAAGRLLVAAGDGSAVVAFDPRRGDLVWRWQPGDSRVAAVAGSCRGGVVVATRSGTEATTLRRIALDDGRQTAEWLPGQASPVGLGAIADGTVVWPVRLPNAGEGDTLAVEVLDAVTLERRREPIECGRAAPEAATGGPAAVQLVVSGDSLVIAEAALTCWRPGAVGQQTSAVDASSR